MYVRRFMNICLAIWAAFGQLAFRVFGGLREKCNIFSNSTPFSGPPTNAPPSSPSQAQWSLQHSLRTAASQPGWQPPPAGVHLQEDNGLRRLLPDPERWVCPKSLGYLALWLKRGWLSLPSRC